jgi:hypothetical protein
MHKESVATLFCHVLELAVTGDSVMLGNTTNKSWKDLVTCERSCHIYEFLIPLTISSIATTISANELTVSWRLHESLTSNGSMGSDGKFFVGTSQQDTLN